MISSMFSLFPSKLHAKVGDKLIELFLETKNDSDPTTWLTAFGGINAYEMVRIDVFVTAEARRHCFIT